jgi:four helix bundle protein
VKWLNKQANHFTIKSEVIMTAKNFEDLNVWKDAKTMVVAVYKTISESQMKRDFGFRDQIQRAAVSVMNNIAEGFERDNNRDFFQFLRYSKGSAGEVRSMLYIALDLDYITKEKFDELYELSVKIVKQIASLRRYLRSLNKNK